MNRTTKKQPRQGREAGGVVLTNDCACQAWWLQKLATRFAVWKEESYEALWQLPETVVEVRYSPAHGSSRGHLSPARQGKSCRHNFCAPSRNRCALQRRSFLPIGTAVMHTEQSLCKAARFCSISNLILSILSRRARALLQELLATPKTVEPRPPRR